MSVAAGIMRTALRALYPPQCPACDAAVDVEGTLCGACWGDAVFLRDVACCTVCAVPLPSPEGGTPEGVVCDDCLARPRGWDRAVAALLYSGTGRGLALALKHGDRPDLARTLGGWMAEAAAPLAGPGTLLVPVPMPLARLVRRRYNQATLLAVEIGRRLALPVAADALRRLRHTAPQDRRPRAEREAAQEGAIGATPQRVAGRAVILVDDVMASGATAETACAALRAAGATQVDVAVLARAAKDS